MPSPNTADKKLRFGRQILLSPLNSNPLDLLEGITCTGTSGWGRLTNKKHFSQRPLATASDQIKY